jgi:hypothetical protein
MLFATITNADNIGMVFCFYQKIAINAMYVDVRFIHSEYFIAIWAKNSYGVHDMLKNYFDQNLN